MTFSEIPGLIDQKKALIGSHRSGHVAHAQLFYGLEGSAALALGLAYAQFLNCETPSEADSCGVCPSCHKMQKFIHPDFHYLMPLAATADMKKGDGKKELLAQWRNFLLETPYGNAQDWIEMHGAKNSQLIISLEEARTLASGLYLKANEGKYKIALIWLAEYLNIASANMLLKILEEPPGDTVFILVTNDYEKILPTILSRVQLHHIQLFTNEEIKQYLTHHFPEAQNDVIENAIYLANGSLNKAVRLMDSDNLGDFSQFLDWMRKAYINDFAGLIRLGEEFSKLGREKQKQLLLIGISLFREVLISSNEPSLAKIHYEVKESFLKFVQAINIDNIELIYNQLNQAFYHIERNANPQITFMNLSVKLNQLIKK